MDTEEESAKPQAGADVVLETRDDADIHEGFMREAIAMHRLRPAPSHLFSDAKQAERALATDETPVGCVFVYDGAIIARGMNATNRTMNGTRHAEFMAIAELITSPPSSLKLPPSAESPDRPAHPTSVLPYSDLYVTVEPCIMCASLLRQYGIRKVYFGASNDKFGGTGGVLSIHEAPAQQKSYEVSGGWLREEAIMLLRRFYVQENGRAPEPRRKTERKLKTEIEPAVMKEKT